MNTVVPFNQAAVKSLLVAKHSRALICDMSDVTVAVNSRRLLLQAA